MVLMGSMIFLFLVLTASVALAITGLLLVRWKVDLYTLKSFHEVAGHMLAVVGTLYAVLLGFFVVDSLSTFQKARFSVEQEANALADVYHLAGGLPSAVKYQLQSTCTDYAQIMISKEWPAMELGKSSSEATEVQKHMWKIVTEFTPSNDKETQIYNVILNEINTLDDCRGSRIVASSKVFDPIIWGVLLSGGTFTVMFTYFFGLENVRVQVLMTSVVTTTLGLNLILVAMFYYPYSGDVKIYPDAFKIDKQLFSQV